MYSNGAATINPAALDSGSASRRRVKNAKATPPQEPLLPRSRPGPRTQHARGPAGDEAGEPKPRKRGRPMKPRPLGAVPDDASQTPGSNLPPSIAQPRNQAQPSDAVAMPPGPAGAAAGSAAYQPQPQQQQKPQPQPAAATPQSQPTPKATPAKPTLKALPTVRDHTTDQLNPSGDEYLPREFDESGEKKVLSNGKLTGSRQYKCRIFLVPNRGDKLFMLATECARVLGYRDSYLLFNKNRSLYKIIASQEEKDDLVSQEILPFSYRSRQIAIVTARSMFRQFGSRVIVDGRRVRDDYWETKARKQGFTEADPAGEKRPGGSKQREATAAAEAAAAAAAASAAQGSTMLGGSGGGHSEIVYNNTAAPFPTPPQPALAQQDLADTRSRDYNNMVKGPRQEMTGPAYSDTTRPSPIAHLHAQAHDAADYSRSVNQQREIRGDYLDTIWRRPHEQPQTGALTQPIGGSGSGGGSVSGAEPSASLPAAAGRTSQSPRSANAAAAAAAAAGLPSQSGMMTGQSPQMMLTNPPYAQPVGGQSQMGQQPAIRGTPGPGVSAAAAQQVYSYPSTTSPMWQPQQQPAAPHQQQQQPQQPSQQQPSQQHPQQQQQQPAPQPVQPPHQQHQPHPSQQQQQHPQQHPHQQHPHQHQHPQHQQHQQPHPYPSYTTSQGPGQQPHQPSPGPGSRTPQQQTQQQQPQQRHQSIAAIQPGGQFQAMSGMPGMPGYPHGQTMFTPDQTPRGYMPPGNPATPAATQGWQGQPTPATSQWWANQGP